MVQYAQTGFDASFAALSDATRRGVLEQLGRADASITDLAGKFHMTLTGKVPPALGRTLRRTGQGC
jgi:DNA-binding transcriptional ArsR family regulator